MTFKWPLMKDNILREDLDAVIQFLQQDDPILTQFVNVRKFEEEWSKWLGVKYSVFVNSGASANLITLATLGELCGGHEVILPALTWSSDVVSVLRAGLTPIFVDIDPKTLGVNSQQVLKEVNEETAAVFITHLLGIPTFDQDLMESDTLIIEDCCEAHGTTYQGRKVGTLGEVSNFSFYYAHHMSTIEGGMVCTDDHDWYEVLRMFRSHGLVREMDSQLLKDSYSKKYPEVDSQFMFAVPGYNVRSTEINAVIGLSQLKRLDRNNYKRAGNLKLFLLNLDKDRFRTDLNIEGAVGYGLPVILREPDSDLFSRIKRDLCVSNGIEFRVGGPGGNQLRHPYMVNYFGWDRGAEFPEADHVHHFGLYVGNYPTLTPEDILRLCDILNK